MFRRLRRRIGRLKWNVQPDSAAAALPGLSVGSALAGCLREGYGWRTFRRDVLAGLTSSAEGLHFAPDRAAAQELARTLCGHTPRLSD